MWVEIGDLDHFAMGTLEHYSETELTMRALQAS